MSINYLRPPAFFDLLIPESQEPEWTYRPEWRDLNRYKYDIHVTARCPKEQIMQACMWAVATSRWAEGYGPQNPTAVFRLLLQLIPYTRVHEYKHKWVEMSARENELVEERMREADGETQARLRAQKKDELNLAEHGRLLYFAIFAVLFGENWRRLLQTALVSVPLSRFPEPDQRLVLDYCRMFL